MTMYKLLAIDIDDTLLNDDLQVTPGTRQALEAAMERGVIVTLATGRMYASAKNVAAGLGLNVPLITYQGSLVKNSLDEKVIYERSVPRDAARYLIDFCREKGLHLQIYHEDKLLVESNNEKVRAYAAMSKIPYQVVPSFDAYADKPLSKMIVIDEPETLERLTEQLTPVIGANVHITKSKPTFLEFLHREGTKGHALAFLAGHFGCGIEQTIAIGDSWNDREMLETAGLGVAMANAVEPLKAIADYVTLSNNDDGIRHVIEKFVLA